MPCLTHCNGGGFPLKYLHEKCLVLRMKVSLWLFQQQERNLIGVGLKQKKLGRHKKEVVVAEATGEAFCLTWRWVEIELKPFEKLVE